MKKPKRSVQKTQVPDTASVYERANPKEESASGKLHAPKPLADKNPDRMHHAVKNRQGHRQINSEEETD